MACVSSVCFVIRYVMFMCAYIWKRKSYQIFIWYLVSMQDLMIHVFGIVLQYEVEKPCYVQFPNGLFNAFMKEFLCSLLQRHFKRVHNCPKWGNVVFLLKLVVGSCFGNPLFFSTYCMIYWIDWLEISNILKVYCTFSWLLKYWVFVNARNEYY